MIDTIFFLLVFFMIASLAMTTMTGIKVALPKASTGEKSSQARVILTMTGNGHVYLKTNSVPWEDAERMAIAQGWHLATVNDAAENDFVRSFGPAWIGFTKSPVSARVAEIESTTTRARTTVSAGTSCISGV